jgi:hypothetical protein
LPGKSKLRRPCMRAEPRPIPLNRDELPTLNFVRYRDPGDARTHGDLPQDLPALASNARNKRSFVPPVNNRPPPVASTGPQFCDIAGMLVVHTPRYQHSTLAVRRCDRRRPSCRGASICRNSEGKDVLATY